MKSATGFDLTSIREKLQRYKTEFHCKTFFCIEIRERERGLLKSLRDTGTDCISNDYKIASVKTEVHFFAPSDVTQLMFNNNYL